MGYRCAPGVTIFDSNILDTFLHLFNVETGTINNAIHSNLYAFDRELNSTPVPTVFLLRHYQSTNHQKIVPLKEYCRHRCNFRFYYYYFHRRRCPGQSFIVEGLKFRKKVRSDSLICTWGYDF